MPGEGGYVRSTTSVNTEVLEVLDKHVFKGFCAWTCLRYLIINIVMYVVVARPLHELYMKYSSPSFILEATVTNLLAVYFSWLSNRIGER